MILQSHCGTLVFLNCAQTYQSDKYFLAGVETNSMSQLREFTTSQFRSRIFFMSIFQCYPAQQTLLAKFSSGSHLQSDWLIESNSEDDRICFGRSLTLNKSQFLLADVHLLQHISWYTTHLFRWLRLQFNFRVTSRLPLRPPFLTVEISWLLSHLPGYHHLNIYGKTLLILSAFLEDNPLTTWVLP